LSETSESPKKKVPIREMRGALPQDPDLPNKPVVTPDPDLPKKPVVKKPIHE
jgi:hypothetical protein